MERAAIVFNPAARNAPSREALLAAVRMLLPLGWQVELLTTTAPGDGTRLAREAAAAGASVVFACGGDGTINEVVNGLVGGEAALGVIRGGMGDVFAKEVGMPRRPAAALRLLVEGDRRRFDLGVAGGRYFLAMCGVGFDASVVASVPADAKRRLGSTSYALWGGREALRYRNRNVALRLDGARSEVDLFWLLLGNTRSYGGVVDIAARARVDDGLLDAYVFEGSGLAWLAATALRIALWRQEGGRGVSYRRVSELTIETPGLGVQADGQPFGETPMRFTVAPAALSVLLPRGGGASLFGASEPSA